MSKLREYIKLLPAGIKNAASIAEAVYNATLLEWDKLPQEKVDEIVRRRLICTACPFNSVNALASIEYFDLTESHYTTSRSELHCSFCGCPVDYRTAALDKNCGIEDYNEKHPDKSLPLKWTVYEG